MIKKTGIFMLSIAAFAWISLPASSPFVDAKTAGNGTPGCPSGRSVAELTGWPLNGKMPAGEAVYDEQSRSLVVSVSSVALSDGQQLRVLVGDDRIGVLGGLKSGEASGTLSRQLEEGDRVRVFDGERPIVSGNLKCAEPTPTPTPSPTTSPTPLPSVTPTATPEPTVTP